MILKSATGVLGKQAQSKLLSTLEAHLCRIQTPAAYHTKASSGSNHDLWHLKPGDIEIGLCRAGTATVSADSETCFEVDFELVPAALSIR